MKRPILALTVALAMCQQGFAQPDTSDPALAGWWDASSLQLNDGDPVSIWTDLSNHGTTLEAQTTTLDGLDPTEANPVYVASDPEFNNQPTVRFVKDGTNTGGDPNVPFSGGTDRLYQTNNLGAGDPLDIGDGSDLTVFLVYSENSTAANGEPGTTSFGSIVQKRGTSSAVYGISTHAGSNRYFTISYGGATAFQANPPAIQDRANLVFLSITEDAAGDPYFFNENRVRLDSVSDGGIVTSRNATVPEAFALGGHSQVCCGEGEWFDGTIAEVIVYSRSLSSGERLEIIGYLDEKYGIIPEPTALALMTIAGVGLAVGRRRR